MGSLPVRWPPRTRGCTGEPWLRCGRWGFTPIAHSTTLQVQATNTQPIRAFLIPKYYRLSVLPRSATNSTRRLL
jgi:hypothetical protein